MNPTTSRKLAVIDIDGTLIDGQSQQMLVKFSRARGQIGFWRSIRLNSFFILYKLGLINDIKKAFELGTMSLKGKKISESISLIDSFVEGVVKKKAFRNGPKLIEELRRDGYYVLILSTAIDLVVSRIAQLFRADDYLSTRLQKDSDFYTGNVEGPILYGKEKAKALVDYSSSHGFALADAVAYADHESDIPMLKIVGKGYIVNPDTHMRHIAQKEGLGIMEMR